MATFSAGFTGRHKRATEGADLPPGQYLTDGFPVLSAGPTPQVPLDAWRLEVGGELGVVRSWTWDEFRALDAEKVTVDVHCVTRWSKLGTTWTGVPVEALLTDVELDGDFVVASSYGGYTTNLPLEDLLDGKAWVAFEYEGEPLDPEHGGPARLLVPHLYFWKSAKWLRGLRLQDEDEAGFLGAARLPRLRRPVEGAAALGRLSWQHATVVGTREETATVRTLTLQVDGWSGHRPGQHVDVRLTAPDGYTAVRPYSIATPENGSRIDVTVALVEDGEVSSYLVYGRRSRNRDGRARTARRLVRLESRRPRARSAPRRRGRRGTADGNAART